MEDCKIFKIKLCESWLRDEYVPQNNELLFLTDANSFIIGDAKHMIQDLPRINTGIYFNGEIYWKPDLLEQAINEDILRSVSVEDLL